LAKARAQTIFCDQTIQVEDVSEPLGTHEAYAYRTVIGTCLCLARDRPDLLFVVKELSGAMGKPTLASLQRLRTLAVYLKLTSDICVLLLAPQPGQGK
jgi:hypothetical protein